MAGSPGFIHLNCHSAYSLLEGALPLAQLIKLAAADMMPAVGVADTANLFGALEFSQKAAERGIQPIIGCKLPIRFEAAGMTDPRQNWLDGRSRQSAPLVLLCANDDGYRALMSLVTRFHMDGSGESGPVPLSAVSCLSSGLIALTGGHDGALYPLLAAGETAAAEERLAGLKAIFGDRLYVSLERHEMEIERAAEPAVAELAYALDIPLVATNEPFFPDEPDYEAHDALLAIAEGRLLSSDDRRRLTPKHGFVSRAEMTLRFADVPEALENSVEIALRCRARPLPVQPILPRFIASASNPQDAERQEAMELRRQAREGLGRRIAALGTAPGFTEASYTDRLDYELGVIEAMRFPGYFLIVADFIQWAKAQGIPVGPGRGSGAGSVVAWSLTITDLDPLRFGLIFERFLNPERVSMPDFDVDFCQERRDEVIGYVQQRYGADRVAQIITFGTLQARAALRDVGRVLEMPYGQVDRLCKLVPADPANPVTLAKAITDEPRFDEARRQEPVVDRLLTIATKLEGLYRHASTHAAGIVISNRPLQDMVPLYRDPRSAFPVTQFNMKWVEQAGLVKFDFLGLKTLTVLDRTVELIRRRGVAIDLATIPLDDKAAYAMLARGEAVGIFQVESQGMRRALVDMRPDRFEDLIVLVALYRPGPMANIPTYCARKLGKEQVDYIHPQLQPILEPTFGIITYQEQVMQIARDLAGYSFGEADLLRRAMGKKIRAEMELQRERFMSGALDRGLLRADAEAIFDACAKFADYGFNKSHSAPYALITYQTAYMKANYPAEFLAASMTLDMGNTDKVGEFRREAIRLGIDVMPPDINRSGVGFEVAEGKIIYALSALKGVGTQAVEQIVQSRNGRPFADLADFATRIDPQIVNRKALECIVQAGGFDALEPRREKVFANIGRIVAAAQERVGRAASGISDLFGAPDETVPLFLAEAEPWTQAERLQHEFSAIGSYLSAHPIDDYKDLLSARGALTWKTFLDQLRTVRHLTGLIGVTVVQRQERRTRTGGRIGIVALSDPTGQFEATVYGEKLADWRDVLEPGISLLVQVSGELDGEGEDYRVRIQNVERLEELVARKHHAIRIFLDAPEPIDRLVSRLDQGEGTVSIVVLLDGPVREVEVKLPGQYRVTPQVLGAIKAVPGIVHAEMR